jgi:hypothetical protein
VSSIRREIPARSKCRAGVREEVAADHSFWDKAQAHSCELWVSEKHALLGAGAALGGGTFAAAGSRT